MVQLTFVHDFPGGSDGKASAYNAGDLGSVPGSGRSPGEGNGNPTSVFFHGVVKSQMRLSNFTFTFTMVVSRLFCFTL